jgi:prepilin-type N-terminal cleavage/methylation domain-containing protein
MRQGFSLLETMLSLAVLGLLCGIAMPHVSTLMDSIEADAAATHLVAAHQRARLMALTRNQILVLTVDTARLIIQQRGQSSVLWSGDGPSAHGAGLAGAARQFTFTPQGLTLGLSNATLDLTRGMARRRVVVSRLGRVRILR